MFPHLLPRFGEELLSEAAALADRLTEGDRALAIDEVDALLKEAGHQPEVLRQRLYEGAETLLYVVAGDGSVRLGGKDSNVAPGSFVSIPRNTPYAISRRGNRPLILLSVLAGEPCEQAQ